MSRINASIGSFLDALVGELQRLLSQDQTEQVTVSWNAGQPDSTRSESNRDGSELVWWSCALSVGPGCRISAGTDRRTWKAIGSSGAADFEPADAGADDPQESWFAVLTLSLEQAAKLRFGALVSFTERGVSQAPPDASGRISVAIDRGGSSGTGTISLVLSPDLAAALGGESEDNAADPVELSRMAEANRAERDAPTAANSLEILHHVEIPVSVSFGHAQMRLKDLLALSNGSVVQLDRELGDEVEIRVNNCVIARGEVVAVDGNYGVRILEMASGEAASSPGGQGIRGALRAG